jgi:hypothetical protein
MLRRALLVLGIVFLSGCVSSKTYTNSNSEKIQLDKGATSIQVRLEGANSREEATNQITNALSREGYRISESDSQAGIVQTEAQEFDGEMLGSSATVRLNVTLEDASTAVVNGEFVNTSAFTGMDSGERISYGGPKGSQDVVAWNQMLRAAEEIGTVSDFKK